MSADPTLSVIEEAAAAWLVERDQGFAPGRERAFEQWLRADERHAAVFAALAETWTMIGESRTPAENVVGIGRERTWWRTLSLAAAVLAVAGLGGWHALRQAMERTHAPYTLTAATDVGLLRKVALPDGSVVHLNTDSAVDVRFDAGVRRVRLLRGEAHFSVAKNSTRPFIVNAAGVDVRVVGTVFNVRLRPESVDVLVTEGRVQVGPPPGPPEVETTLARTPQPLSELKAGQKTSVTLAATAPRAVPPVDVTSTEIRQALAWQARRLDFDATPLREIVAEINRYNRHKLVVADARLEEQRFGGSFPASDYATFVRMLETDFGVVAERREAETLLRLRAR
jgi:transmembrane sensor